MLLYKERVVTHDERRCRKRIGCYLDVLFRLLGSIKFEISLNHSECRELLLPTFRCVRISYW